LCDDGTWKVLDFGVAALDDHSGTLTQGKVVGTPAYMAPEQARGEKVDHRADLYALAAIAYRWLTGRPVCGGKDLHAALYQTVHVMPQRPSSLAELHEDVDDALALGLAKDPHARWTSVGELRDALAAALAGDLDPRIRRRARDLITAHPWGAVRG
jgi:serine/threonine-protein kinase